LYELDDILEQGVDKLVDSGKYLNRGGIYDWKGLYQLDRNKETCT